MMGFEDIKKSHSSPESSGNSKFAVATASCLGTYGSTYNGIVCSVALSNGLLGLLSRVFYLLGFDFLRG